MPAKKHTHKYHKLELGNAGKVWSCALRGEGCTHHIPKYMESTILGRKSICWECDNEFIMGPESIQMEFPKCNECSGVNDLVGLVGKLGKE